jgi:tetratricopeptide (TPR) repeat protein
MADTPPTRHAHTAHEKETQKNDFAALLAHVQLHPWVYIGAAGFVVAILFVTGMYRLAQKSAYERSASEFARALDVQDPGERATALAKIASGGSALSARALYMQGESALQAGDREGARKAFIGLRESFPDFDFVPEAVEGLGLLEEDAGNFAQARSIYEEVAAKWPNSAAAQRQPFNIARCLEGEKDLSSAINRYRDQLEVFPGSTIAQRAQLRLTELRAEHPDLFPAEVAQGGPSVIQPMQAAPDTAAAPAATPTPGAPAPETPPVAEPSADKPAQTPPAPLQ